MTILSLLRCGSSWAVVVNLRWPGLGTIGPCWSWKGVVFHTPAVHGWSSRGRSLSEVELQAVVLSLQ